MSKNDLSYGIEQTYGAGDAATFTSLPYTGAHSLVKQANRAISTELKEGIANADRQENFVTGGDVPFDYTVKRYNDFFLAALRSDFVDNGDGTETAKLVANDTALSKSFVVVNDVYSVSSLYYHLTGMRVAQINIEFNYDDVASGTITFEGKDSNELPLPDPIAAAIANTAKTGGMGIGNIMIDGNVPMSCVQSISLTINMNLRDKNCLGGQGLPTDKLFGEPQVTGSFTAYFDSEALYDMVLDGSHLALSWEYETDGNIDTWNLPKLSIGGAPEWADNDGDNMITLEFTALCDETEETSLTLTQTV